MLKIQRSANGNVVFTLSGRIEAEDVEELRRMFALEKPDHPLVLDLKDVTLADGVAIRFLTRCEAGGIQLERCPPYVREWVQAEKHRRSRAIQRRSAR